MIKTRSRAGFLNLSNEKNNALNDFRNSYFEFISFFFYAALGHCVSQRVISETPIR